ncbi:MAG: Hpt domain-containing protein [Pseudomonadota bacterium]
MDQLLALSDVDAALDESATESKADEDPDAIGALDIVDLTDIGDDETGVDDTLPRLIDLENDATVQVDSLADDVTMQVDSLADDLTMQIDNLVEGDMEHDQTIHLESLLDSDLDDDLTIQLDRLTAAEVPEEQPQEPEPEAAIPEPPRPVAPAPMPKPQPVPMRVISEDVDEEILEVFIEEALDELTAVNEFLPKWRLDNDDEESLTRVRRAFHTLKGSGRLVGAEVIGEFAWHNENLLNYVLRGDLHPSDKLFSLLNESVAVLPQLIAQLKGDDTQVEFYNLVEEINNLIDLSKTGGSLKEEEAEPTLADLEESDLQAHISEAEPEEIAPTPISQDDVEVTELAPPPEESSPLDGTGLEIELEEVVGADEEVFADEDPLDISVVDVDEFDDGDVEEVIAFDIDQLDFTLGEPDVEESELAPPPEEPIDVDRVDHGIDPVLLEIFSKESRVHLETLRKILQQSSELSGTVQPNDKLIRALHTLHGSAQTAQVEEIARLTGPFEKVAKHKREIGQAFDPEESELLSESVDCVFDTLDALVNNREIPVKVEQLANQVSGYTETALAEIEAAEVDEGDSELRKIFIEEADELVNAAESIIGQWREAPNDYRPVSEMKRRLHTLKGGARMAGYAPVADLTHALESSIIAREASGQPPAADYFDLLQEAVDALAVNVDQARKGQEIGRFDWIVKDLSKGLSGSQEKAELPAVAPVSEEEAPTAPAEPSPPEEPPPSVEPVAPVASEPTDRETVAGGERTSPTIEELAARARASEPRNALESSSDPEASTYDSPLQPAAPEPTPSAPSDEPVASSAVQLEPNPVLQPVVVDPAASLSNVVPLKMTANAIEEALKDSRGGPPAATPARTGEDKSQEQVRVRSELLDSLVNNAGEVSIYHARFGQQIGDMRFNLNELDQTVVRLREQLRLMDQETEAQILYGYDQESERENKEFDPLELDRYSQIQELSRSLLESVADLENIKGTLADLTRDSETLLLQQSRVSTELQEGLLRTRMVRFDGVEARLSRVVRQTAQSLRKKATLSIAGGENEIDRGVQERMIAPIEHILRNAIAHGIEAPEDREKVGKPTNGKVAIRLSLDGGDILIRIVDDGAGISVESVRRTALERDLIGPDVQLSDQEVLQLLFESGFSTAEEVTQIAGRGIGLDVVGREIKQLGGSLTLESEEGVGTMFVIRLPQTLAISQALLVESAGQIYAVPINGIRGVSRVSVAELSQYYLDPEKRYPYAGDDYQVIHLTELLQVEAPQRDPTEQVPLIMVRSGDEMAAVQVDELIGRREIVVKSAGEQVSMLRGIAGATLLGDGKVVLVLDIGGLLQTMERGRVLREQLAEIDSPAAVAAVPEPPAPTEEAGGGTVVMVVDDSITIRKVTARMLERHKLNVMTAKDGVDAVSQLKETKPDLMLLDIEMPRMDGFEVAGFVRKDERLHDLPIIVITSRTGDKHRQRMFDIGVDKYLGKPYQETELIQLISEVLGRELVSQ